jgi:predicted GNAT family acetyltransferase
VGPKCYSKRYLEREACAVEEWQHGGSEFRRNEMAGVFKGHELAALASYQIWGEKIAPIAIVTHPAFRGQGYATAAVSSSNANDIGPDVGTTVSDA